MRLWNRRRKNSKTERFELRSIVSFAVLDVFVYVETFLSILFTLDQGRIIWLAQSAQNVSLTTWSFYIVSSLTWLTYGYVHRDRVLIITNYAWLFANTFIVVGIILYR